MKQLVPTQATCEAFWDDDVFAYKRCAAYAAWKGQILDHNLAFAIGGLQVRPAMQEQAPTANLNPTKPLFSRTHYYGSSQLDCLENEL